MEFSSFVTTLAFLTFLSTNISFCGQIPKDLRPSHYSKHHVVLPNFDRLDSRRYQTQERNPSFSNNYEHVMNYYESICHERDHGYYGDPNYECRIFHVCQGDGRHDSFFCPAWTRFNNQLQICDWQHKVDEYCNALYTFKEAPYVNKESYAMKQLPAYKADDPYHEKSKYVPEDNYKNKYQEQEYYQAVYEQQDPKMKLSQGNHVPVYQTKRPLMYVQQPIFTVPQAHSFPGVPQSQPEISYAAPENDPGQATESPLTQISPTQPSGSYVGAEDELDTRYPANSKTEPQPIIPLPPTTNHDILQNPQSGNYGTEGKSTAVDAAGAAEGTAYSPEVVDQVHGNVGGHDNNNHNNNPVIELWIPTKVKKLTYK